MQADLNLNTDLHLFYRAWTWTKGQTIFVSFVFFFFFLGIGTFPCHATFFFFSFILFFFFFFFLFFFSSFSSSFSPNCLWGELSLGFCGRGCARFWDLNLTTRPRPSSSTRRLLLAACLPACLPNDETIFSAALPPEERGRGSVDKDWMDGSGSWLMYVDR